MSKKLLSFITKHKTNELLKGALFLFSGTVIAQLISIVSLPVLQHYYPPEDFALLNTFTSLTVLISSVATFKLEYAIVPAKSSLEATKIALTSSIYVFLISLVSMLIFLLLPALILPKKLHEASLLFVIGVPLSTFLFANNEIVMFWQNRLGQFKRMSAGKIFNSASMESSRFIMLAINEKIPGLVIGRILGYATNLIYSLSSLGIKEMPKLFGLINWKVVKKISVRYKSFPLFTMPSSLLNNLTAYLFLYLFITFYNNHEAGLVTVANQYVGLPLGLIASSLSQVFFKQISALHDNNDLIRVYKYYALRLGLLGLCFIVIILLIPDSLISGLLGSQWIGLNPYLKLSVIWQSVAFISSTLSFIYTRLMILNVMFFFSLAQLMLMLICLNLSYFLMFTSLECFAFYTIVQSGYYIITIFFTLRFIKNDNRLDYDLK